VRRLIVSGRTLLLAASLLGAATVASLALAGQPTLGTPAPGEGPHLVVVPHSPKGQAALVLSSARQVAGYDTYTLVEATGADVTRLVAAGGELRDDMREVRIGMRSVDPKLGRPSLLDKSGAARRAAGRGAYGLAVVQYVGPLKDAWIQAVRKTGVEVVSYMAQNAQLVSGDGAALAELAALSTREAFLRAVTPYTAADKQLPGLPSRGRADIVVSTVAGEAGAAARAAIDRIADRRSAAVNVAGIVQQHIAVEGTAIAGLAELGGVVAIEPSVEPKLLDERAARIVAGQLNTSFQPVLGTGHLSYLLSHGFTNMSPVIVDITDEGIDKGVIPAPAGSHPDFYTLGSTASPSRIVYAHESTAADVSAMDCGGHGTNVASIATGYNAQTGALFEDAQGFNYGVGIQPFGKVGATKIFNCAGLYDVTTSITALHDSAYASGARISNNSWGAAVGGAYTTTSREFDALVRDARPATPGNQQFTEVVAAGNAGSGANTIGAPGTAKNVITVGASENVRPIGGTDGCGVTDTEADSARDIVDFSSRGPTDDGRTKPEIVAPGTHVTGAQPQSGLLYNGSGTCNPQFPAGSTRYTLVSGTSQATPEVTGLASLIHTWFRNGLGGGIRYPSPAMTKALMVNTATDLAGGADGAGAVNAKVPTQIQGWGRVNLARVLDGTARQVIDQTAVLTTTGTATTRFYNVASAARPLRATLAWTDAPGPTSGNSFVNDLDLEVTVAGTVYKGNVFAAGRSIAGGGADPRNNVENVFLPAGVTGAVKVRVIAKNLPGDGVPGVGDATDQDFALVISNVGAPVASTAVLADAGHTLTLAGDGDAVLEPGEPFTLAKKLRNVGNATATGTSGTMSAPAADATITQGAGNWPDLAANVVAANTPAFRATVQPTLVCGDQVDLTIQVASSAGPLTLPTVLQTGQPGAVTVTQASTDVPKAIPDANPTGVVSNRFVSPYGFLTDMNITIGSLMHTFDSDLTIDVISPAGTIVRVFNRHGGGGDNLTDTVFDDAATTSITAGAAPFTGSFRPFEPLSTFNGQQIHGTWKLKIVDDAGMDTGTLNSWSHTRQMYGC
jgi:subtilisin-like proprotein convertase family protein